MARQVKLYEERLSALAISSLAMGILCLILFLFHRLYVFLFVVDILLGIGAIVTGLWAMRRMRIYSLKGRTLAYAGVVLGANGLFWLLMNVAFRAIY